MFRVTAPALLGAASILALSPGAAMTAPPGKERATTAAKTVRAPAKSDLPADSNIRFGTLPNGMRYAIMKNGTPRGEASLRLRIDAGSLHEAENQRGIAHFLEHMVLNGTTNVPEGEFVRILERHGLKFGPDTNASTSFTQTVYKLALPELDDETVDTALYLLREVADEATLSTTAINAERGIVLSEERTRSSPNYRVLVDEIGYLLPGQLMPNRLPIGVPEVIRTAPRERFVEFYQAYYRPERATMVAVGDFDVDAMEAKIRKQFSSWKGEGKAGAEPDLGRISERMTEARVMIAPGSSERVAITWLTPADLSPDTRATRLKSLHRRLALGILNNRLSRIAATASPPPFISAGARRTNQVDSATTVQLSASVRPGEWRPALEVIEQEQRRLVEHGVSQAEIDREIAGIRAALEAAVSGAATRHSAKLSDGIVGAVDNDNVFTAPATDLGLFNQSIAQLTPQAVAQTARELFQGQGPLLYMSTAAAAEDTQAAMLAAFNEARAKPVAALEEKQVAAWPYTSFGKPGSVVERKQYGADIGATSVRFANGVWLTVRPTDFANDEVLVSVRTGDGRGNLPPGKPSPSWALGPSFVAGGMGKMTFEDMREALAGRVLGLQGALHDDSFVLNGRTRPQDFAAQMQLIAAYVTDPGWRPSGWDRMRSLSATTHARYEATPDGVYERDGALLVHGGDSRWSTPTEAQMKASSIADAKDLLADAFAREPIEVIVVGDITVDEAIAQTAATFGALPTRIEEPDVIPGVNFAAPTKEPLRLTHKGRPDQALAMLAWPTAGSLADSAQTRTLGLLSEVFRLRLTQRIREELGTTYSPRAIHVTSPNFDTFGFLFGRIEAPPESLDEFMVEAEKIATDLRTNPISADELQRARQPVLEDMERARRSNGWWQFSLAKIHKDPRVLASIQDQRSLVEAITPETLRSAAAKFMRPERAWKLMIVPEAKPAAKGG